VRVTIECYLKTFNYKKTTVDDKTSTIAKHRRLSIEYILFHNTVYKYGYRNEFFLFSLQQITVAITYRRTTV